MCTVSFILSTFFSFFNSIYLNTMGLLPYTHQIIIETEHTMNRTQNTAENVRKFTIILNLEPL